MVANIVMKVYVWNMQKLWNHIKKINIAITLLTLKNNVFNPLDGEESDKWR